MDLVSISRLILRSHLQRLDLFLRHESVEPAGRQLDKLFERIGSSDEYRRIVGDFSPAKSPAEMGPEDIRHLLEELEARISWPNLAPDDPVDDPREQVSEALIYDLCQSSLWNLETLRHSPHVTFTALDEKGAHTEWLAPIAPYERWLRLLMAQESLATTARRELYLLANSGLPEGFSQDTMRAIERMTTWNRAENTFGFTPDQSAFQETVHGIYELALPRIRKIKIKTVEPVYLPLILHLRSLEGLEREEAIGDFNRRSVEILSLYRGTALTLRPDMTPLDVAQHEAQRSRAVKTEEFLADRQVPSLIHLVYAEILCAFEENPVLKEKTGAEFYAAIADYYTGMRSFKKGIRFFRGMARTYHAVEPWKYHHLPPLEIPSWLMADPAEPIRWDNPPRPFTARFLSEEDEPDDVRWPQNALTFSGSSEADLRRATGFFDYVLYLAPQMKLQDPKRTAEGARLLSRHPETLDPERWSRHGLDPLPPWITEEREAIRTRLTSKTDRKDDLLNEMVLNLERLAALIPRMSTKTPVLPVLIEALQHNPDPEPEGAVRLAGKPVRIWVPWFLQDQVIRRFKGKDKIAEIRAIEELLCGHEERAREVQTGSILHRVRLGQTVHVVSRMRAETLKKLADSDRKPELLIKNVFGTDLPPEARQPLKDFLYAARQKPDPVPDDKIAFFLLAAWNFHPHPGIRSKILVQLGSLSRQRNDHDLYFRFIRHFAGKPEGLKDFLDAIGVPTKLPALPSRVQDHVWRRGEEWADPFFMAEAFCDHVLHYQGGPPPFPLRPALKDEDPDAPHEPFDDSLDNILWRLQHDPASLDQALRGLRQLFLDPEIADPLLTLCKKYLSCEDFPLDLIRIGFLHSFDPQRAGLPEIARLIRSTEDWDHRMSGLVHRFEAPGLLEKHLRAYFPHLIDRDRFPSDLGRADPFATFWELEAIQRVVEEGDVVAFQLLPRRMEHRSTDGRSIDSRGLAALEVKTLLLRGDVDLDDQTYKRFKRSLIEAALQIRTQVGKEKGRGEIHVALRMPRQCPPELMQTIQKLIPKNLGLATGEARTEIRRKFPLSVHLSLFGPDEKTIVEQFEDVE